MTDEGPKSPFSLYIERATSVRTSPEQSTHDPNVLPLCRGAEGDVGHERRVGPAVGALTPSPVSARDAGLAFPISIASHRPCGTTPSTRAFPHGHPGGELSCLSPGCRWSHRADETR